MSRPELTLAVGDAEVVEAADAPMLGIIPPVTGLIAGVVVRGKEENPLWQGSFKSTIPSSCSRLGQMPPVSDWPSEILTAHLFST